MNLAQLDPGIERVAVFRALMLGDLLCAVPALRALRRALPQAQLALVGLPWAEALTARLGCVDEFIAFPGAPGLPEQPADPARLSAFIQAMQARRFDLAVQLHGSGGIVNPLVAAFGARHSCGFADAAAWVPSADAGLYAPWPETGHEIERLLHLTDHLGLPRAGMHLEFPLLPSDHAQLRQIWPEADAAPYVCVHAGAQWPSRRWNPRRFAEVADAIARRGRTVVLTGSPGEVALVAQVRQAMQAPAVDLSGRTSLWTLGALIDGAQAVVCNDTGISHIAAALRRPSVVVASGSDTRRWAPLNRRLHRVLAQDLPCRPCAHPVCPTQHECAEAIGAAQVLQALAVLEATTGTPNATPPPGAMPGDPAMPVDAVCPLPPSDAATAAPADVAGTPLRDRPCPPRRLHGGPST